MHTSTSVHKKGPAPSQFHPESPLEIFDVDYKHGVEVPSQFISHLPPARLNITRLVICRNFNGTEGSCAMGDSCKFVHVSLPVPYNTAIPYPQLVLETFPHHPIHVNYTWRSHDVCSYVRLPAAAAAQRVPLPTHVPVLAPNNRQPIDSIPTENLLVTKGSLSILRKLPTDATGPQLSHCAHYFFNRMCNRGDQCNFIHAVHIDPTLTESFKRAPAAKQIVPSSPQPHINPAARRSISVAEKPVNPIQPLHQGRCACHEGSASPNSSDHSDSGLTPNLHSLFPLAAAPQSRPLPRVSQQQTAANPYAHAQQLYMMRARTISSIEDDFETDSLQHSAVLHNVPTPLPLSPRDESQEVADLTRGSNLRYRHDPYNLKHRTVCK